VAELAVDGVPLRLLDLSSDGPWFVRTSSGDIRTADALTEDEAVRAFALGRLAVDREVDGGADVLLVGALAGDSGCAVAAVAAVVTGRQPQTAVPRTGVATDVWIRTVEVVRDARARAKPLAGQALPLLAAVGGADLAALSGILVQAAQRRTPVLLAGPAAHVAGLVAETYAEGCSLWWSSASSSGDPAEAAALAALELEPVLDLGLSFEGYGSAVLAYGLLQGLLALL
jgi:nicotinate-nucleotide--dimethylbenzimidazole phosphoribosyltransferase